MNALDSGHDGRAAITLLETLELSDVGARTTEDIFVGRSQLMPHRRIYGGQVLAQSLVAAGRTVSADHAAHSMHAYFLRPGDDTQTVTFSVDRLHDGRSFATRRVQAYQDGVPIFSMIASYQTSSPGLEHQAPMPEGIPGPEEIGRENERTMRTASGGFLLGDVMEIRHVEGAIHEHPAEHRSPRQHLWLRSTARLPDDPDVHRAALLYMSDLTIQESTLRNHGLSWSHPGLKSASLDHAMWFHRFGRADEWLLYAQESTSARGGRGLSRGHLYTRDGTLVASVAQESMVRVPAQS
ncbi:acyl-CoA thioesterase [Microbacterium sp. No. 7]|uniref:acyl-CoA thioesterase n=1 Tax=Microbacterium sp. No. 7 TaxID=1714373 RepID=UPI0006D242FF|nr:acyl-CoA thioesterase II [Microbacterium sp. No. 7]ALJ20268.1 acyl-CoA thioesterase [Microbacterium sp. No. 7]